VLGVELAHLVAREVTEAQRLELDVERARRSQAARVAAARGFVIADVAEAAEDNGRGKARRPVGEARPELPQHSEQARPPERVDLVEEERDRARAGASPRDQLGGEEPLIAFERHSGGAQLGGERELGAAVQLAKDGPLGSSIDIAGRLPHLTREHQGCEASRGGELGRERPKGGGLARLPRGMQDEVRHLLDQARPLRQAARRRDHVVELGIAGPGRVEAALHRAGAWASLQRSRKAEARERR